MNADRVEVFHRADGNYIALLITHYLILDFLPTCDTPFNKNLSDRRKFKSVCSNFTKFVLVINDTAACTAECKCRTNDNRVADFVCKIDSRFNIVYN